MLAPHNPPTPHPTSPIPNPQPQPPTPTSNPNPQPQPPTPTPNPNTSPPAELVAAVLKAGGMLSPDSNPGSATPHSLYKLYSKQAAATANPYMLRQSNNLSMHSIIGHGHQSQQTLAQRVPLLGESVDSMDRHSGKGGGHGGSHRRGSNSPPRASFRVLSAAPPRPQVGFQNLRLSLTSLKG